MAAFPTEVKIVEVGARDGLQNEKSVTAADKNSLINLQIVLFRTKINIFSVHTCADFSKGGLL